MIAAAPSILNPKGSEASTLAGVWWLMFALGAAVYVVVAGLILWAIFRNRRDRAGADSPERTPADTTWIVWGGLIIPVIILAVIAVTTVRATAELRKPDRNALAVEVTGKRWWWQISYDGFTTANELHLPAGRPVVIGLDSDNVVHSFRIPELAGTVDMIPGQHNELRFTPRTPGTYRGVCAEFCGIEHARMQFVVVVQTPADFERWALRQTLVPLPPDGESAAAGEQAFMREACAGCHMIRGTQAQGTVGPDLTDFGGRSTLGAATIANSADNLRRWIADAQSVKPGALMPPFPQLSDTELRDMVAYLEGLK